MVTYRLFTFYFLLFTFYSTETTSVSHRNDTTAQRLMPYRSDTDDTADLKVGTTYVQLRGGAMLIRRTIASGATYSVAGNCIASLGTAAS